MKGWLISAGVAALILVAAFAAIVGLYKLYDLTDAYPWLGRTVSGLLVLAIATLAVHAIRTA